MPRQARLDLPGLLQHVMVRGIERREVFADDVDRQAFCSRLTQLLEETGTQCLAWALLPNHAHLLLRPLEGRLARFMRRLLTGYAVTFNRRHRRSGHLFQNRYKSIVCEEEDYLLELVRYIHLNPVRAGLVQNVEALARYAWSGHAVLMGRRELAGQAVEEVLGRFGPRVRGARKRYEEFVKAGVARGRREELVGGGLRRSIAFLGKSEGKESFDERVLGSGAFVDRLRQEEELRDRVLPFVGLEELIERVARHYGLSAERIVRRSTDKRVSDARGLVFYLAVEVFGVAGTDVGKVLGVGRSGASRCVARGRAVMAEQPRLVDTILSPSESVQEQELEAT